MQAFFLNAGPDQRLALFHVPPGASEPRGALLYVHPFAEEMNASRAVVAQQARVLAQRGVAVLQLDLKGCGDSAGDFAEASWAAWLDDVRLARDWLAARLPGVPLGLWGLRAGCLLAAEAARRDPPSFGLMWQPVLSGQQHVSQFVRLQRAADMVQGGRSAAAGTHAGQWAAGHTVEVLGYAVAAALASGLGAATLDDWPGRVRLHVLEVSVAGAVVSPALAAQGLRWQQAGAAAVLQAVAGPLLWQAPAVSPCSALSDATVQAVEAWLAGAA